MEFEALQQQLGYYFNDTRLLKTALVHRSYLNEKERDTDVTQHNERLEFLGDAVLELIVTDYLYKNVKEAEGFLTALRASLVNYKIIGEVGIKIGLETQILLSQGEKAELGKARLSIVADSVEAVIGSMYLDGGMEPCNNFIVNNILIYLPDIISNESYKDHKTAFQEYAQAKVKTTPHYRVMFTEGKDHEKSFHIGVWLGDTLMAEGEGRSKQEAETEAAKVALEQLKNQFEQSTSEELL